MKWLPIVIIVTDVWTNCHYALFAEVTFFQIAAEPDPVFLLTNGHIVKGSFLFTKHVKGLDYMNKN